MLTMIDIEEIKINDIELQFKFTSNFGSNIHAPSPDNMVELKSK